MGATHQPCLSTSNPISSVAGQTPWLRRRRGCLVRFDYPMPTTVLPLVIHTEGFALKPDLSELVARKAATLSRSGGRLVRLRLTIERLPPHHREGGFKAVAILERAGPDLVVHAEAVEPEAVVGAVVEKLARGLLDDAGARQHDRRHPHAVEIGGAMPKIS